MTTMVEHEALLMHLVAQRHGDPALALRTLQSLDGDRFETLSGLHQWAMGLSCHELGRHHDAQVCFAAAIHAATAAGEHDLRAKVSASLAVSLLQVGDSVGAETQWEHAWLIAGDDAKPFVTYIGGLLAQRSGLAERALQLYDLAEPMLVAAEDFTSLGALWLNRGLLHTYAGRLDRAFRDYGGVEYIAEQHRLRILGGMAAQNLGFAQGRNGRLADSLLAFDRAAQAYRSVGAATRQIPVLDSDRAEVLLTAGLLVDARQSALAAVRALEADDNHPDLGEAHLLLARICLANDDLVEARHAAVRAARSFRRLRRPGWVSLALYTGLVAESKQATQSRSVKVSPSRLKRVYQRLAAWGWRVEALDAQVWLSRLALLAGDATRAERELVEARAARWCDSPAVRSNAWLATAELCLFRGDTRRATVALRRGLNDVDLFRRDFGSTEAAAVAVRYGLELARIGVELAMAEGEPFQVLWWAERLRAVSMEPANVPAPANPELEEALNQMRRAVHYDVPAQSAQTNVREQALRGTTGSQAPHVVLEPLAERLSALQMRLGDATLVEFVRHGEHLSAVVVTATDASVRSAGLLAPIELANSYLNASLRMAAMVGNARAGRRLLESADDLRALLVRPLDLGDVPLLISPTSPLHDVAWAAMAQPEGAELTIVSSASHWLHDSQRAMAPTTSTAFVVGPGLSEMASEVHPLARRLAGSVVFTGAKATVAATLSALETYHVVHLAAHGRFLPNSPMFSAIQLADGPLTAYDQQRLQRVPNLVVLAACEMGGAAASVGDETLGLASILLAQGVRWVIAPMTPVPDKATADLMIDLHGELEAGCSPPTALIRAATAARKRGSVADVVAASAFVCYGAAAAEPRRDNGTGLVMNTETDQTLG